MQAVWASSGHAKSGQPEKAAEAVHFLPKSARPRKLPTIAQVAGLMPASPRTQIRDIRL